MAKDSIAILEKSASEDFQKGRKVVTCLSVSDDYLEKGPAKRLNKRADKLLVKSTSPRQLLKTKGKRTNILPRRPGK